LPSWTSWFRDEACLTILDNTHISAYYSAVRRRAGSLVPLELAICSTAATLLRRGRKDFHGYEIAKYLANESERRLLTAYGTLYRALGRLEAMGLLESRWEDPAMPARDGRPARRLYTLTASGMNAVEAARAEAGSNPQRAARRPVPA
jgi:PadR family transcriptional regulator PadR